jgi:hypothetical protein
MDCYLINGGERKHAFEMNDYDSYEAGKKGNQLPNEEGKNGAHLPEGDYTVDNDRSDTFGPKTPSISNNGKPGQVKLPNGTTKSGVRIHPQKNRSEGCGTIPDTDDSKPAGSEKQDDLRSPHMNLIRELIKEHGPMKLTVKDTGPCDPETCKEDYDYPSTTTE